MRNRNTIEYLGIWETLYNPNLKPLEFERFKTQAGLNAVARQQMKVLLELENRKLLKGVK